MTRIVGLALGLVLVAAAPAHAITFGAGAAGIKSAAAEFALREPGLTGSIRPTSADATCPAVAPIAADLGLDLTGYGTIDI